MKSDSLELTFSGKKPVEIPIRLDSYEVHSSCLSYVEAGEEWRVVIPFHRLDTWRFRRWLT